MTKRSVIRLVLSVVLMTYIGIAMYFAVKAEGAEHYRGLEINIVDAEHPDFVTPGDINGQLGGLAQRIAATPRDSINTLAIERQIMAMDNIEHANCVVLNNGTVRLDVTPLLPVARVFDANGSTYYINHAGKRMLATTQFRKDVPVIAGHFGKRVHPVDLIPILDYIEATPRLAALVSEIHVNRRGDIMIVPMVRGHVINFGDTSDIANKFDRIEAFYHRVMPVKGWEYYDTISVKWRGQVVAKKHVSTPKNNFLPVDEFDEIDDPGTMQAPDSDEAGD